MQVDHSSVNAPTTRKRIPQNSGVIKDFLENRHESISLNAPTVLVVALILVVETLALSGLLGFLIYQLATYSPDLVTSSGSAFWLT